jgi:hypothetical protein
MIMEIKNGCAPLLLRVKTSVDLSEPFVLKSLSGTRF